MNATDTAPAPTVARQHERRAFPLLGFIAIAGVYMAFLTFDQSHWWKMRSDYSFGWLVPFFAGYVLLERWPRLRACAAAGGPAALALPWRAGLDAIAWLLLAAGLTIFAFGSLYRAGLGASQPGSFALALGFSAILLSSTYLVLPPGSLPCVDAGDSSKRRDARLAGTALVVFPALVWLISAPLASAIESAISLFLLRKVVVVVSNVYSLLGFSLIQEGNVLILPKGQVGVAEACSGIRSLMGCLFAGSFLAAVFLDRWWKKALLVAAAMGLAFFTNLLRSIFLTGWAYAYGSEAIEGTLHDATGYAVLGLTSVGLFALLPLFRPRNGQRQPAVGTPAEATRPT